ncbi:MAG: hypothetical protein ABSF83_03105 [Nitrososphaerales archaeon]
MRGVHRRPGLALALIALMVTAAAVVPSVMARTTASQAGGTALDAPASDASPPSASSSSLFPHHGPPPRSSAYDEQLGLTFTQDFVSLEYSVTAVEQVDPTLGTGAAYLLNGLSNSGYWFQVGVSYSWSPGAGFTMNYEVWDPSGNSVFPRSGGGLLSFTGTVDANDTIALNIYFTNSGGDVAMVAEDLQTGAYAQVGYPSAGASYFVGLPSSDANANGYFTGLMTEWYHGEPYDSNLQETVFSSSYAMSSAWVWLDEFGTNSGQAVFSANSTIPVSFTADPTQLQEFAHGNVTVYASAYEFVTGALSGSTTGGSSSTTALADTKVPVSIVPTQGDSRRGTPAWAYALVAALLFLGLSSGCLAVVGGRRGRGDEERGNDQPEPGAPQLEQPPPPQERPQHSQEHPVPAMAAG